MKSNTISTVKIFASDMTGQREYTSNVPTDDTCGETIDRMVANMALPKNKQNGDRSIWKGQLEREGRYLHPSEIVGDVLEDGDRIVLLPEVNAA